ncbi:TetR family transcriptional regulator [Epidermidibacterium keratini]|uniref:TetR family transcriptional regulator n=1 Tax=Epidermidibacterium keratini TaxID=1891644 RepID=A0A7L4YMU5_9ACTN|nr:TetR family transcriptional regulator [Epidermidibacterium keratini]
MLRPVNADGNDGRRLRGNRTRGIVLDAAVNLASEDGLEPLSFGRLATQTGVSKAGVQALFGTKQELQLATIAHAARVFAAEVIAPTDRLTPGAERLTGLVERWIEYAETPLFSGGCFWSATMPEQDSHPGPVRDALVSQRDAWIGLLARELAEARSSATEDGQLAAFQLNAVLSAVNSALRLGEASASDRARDTARQLINA